METNTQYIDILKLILPSAATLLGVVLSWFLKYKYGEYKQKKIDRELTHSKLIQTILDQLLVEYRCQRAFVFQRHNGGKYHTGKSMTKLSTSFEALEEGVSTEFTKYQNLPMSLYTNFVEDVLTHKAVYPSVEDISDLITKAFFTQRGSKSAVVYPIRKNNELIALVGFEWTHKPEKLDSLLLKIEEDLNTTSETLSKLL